MDLNSAAAVSENILSGNLMSRPSEEMARLQVEAQRHVASDTNYDMLLRYVLAPTMQENRSRYEAAAAAAGGDAAYSHQLDERIAALRQRAGLNPATLASSTVAKHASGVTIPR